MSTQSLLVLCPANNSSDPMARSLIGDFELNKAKSSSPQDKQAGQLGQTLLDRAESIYVQTKALRTLASNAKENPARFGCSVVALISGVAGMWSGDIVTGGIVTVLGAKEIYNQCNSGGTSTLQRLLNDLNADVDMIRSLEEGQQKSYQVIEENLNLINGEVNNLYNKLDEIKHLNTESINSLEKGKKLAYEKGIEAKLAYRKALELFSAAKQDFGSSKEIYQKCAGYFSEIQQIATDEDQGIPVLEKLSTLLKVAETANKECSKGKQILDNADQNFIEAMKALAHAQSLKDQAIEMISKTVQNAEDMLKAGAEKIIYTKSCQEKVTATKKELEEVKERSNDVMRLLDEMSEEIKKAKAEAAKKLDPADLVVGIGAGIASVPLGTVSALAIGVTAAYAWHNGTTITETTKKVCNYFLGSLQPLSLPLREDEMIRIHLQEKSSGYYGAWVKNRQSFTHGSVHVNLGQGEIMRLPFNLNEPSYPVSKEDLFTLYQRMFVKLEKGTLSSKRCKDILNALQHVVISRGGLNPDVKGIIKERQAAHGLVKALFKLCDKLQTN